MAHPGEKRAQLKGLYVYQRQPMETACEKLGVPRSTANRWKKEALAEGDDWDFLRAATALGDENFASLSKKLLEDYLVQHQSTMDLLRDATDMGPLQRAETLSRMADSFNKTMAAFKRLAPDLDRQSVQIDVIQRFAAFAKARYPQHLAALVEMLEPFGEELAKGA
ncbi:MAG: DUF1804 family protein [Acidovorax sp.]|uniref:DUF1804 family protein n=1 Tax=Acidovorax sp. TaxID=1872122 RepID=UPI0039E2BBDE